MENQSSGDDDSDTASESDWEEVSGEHGADDEVEYMKAQLENPNPKDDVPQEIPPANTLSADGMIKIVLPHPSGLRTKKKSKAVDIIGNYIVREINKCKKEVFLDLHRVGLLCLLAQGLQYNAVLRDESVLSTALSILPSERAYPPKHMDLAYIEKFVTWFKKAVVVLDSAKQDQSKQSPAPNALEEQLLEQIGTRTALNHPFLVFIFVTILRALGIQVRLVLNLSPPPIKPESKDLMKLLKEDNAKDPQPSTSKDQVPTTPVKVDKAKAKKQPKVPQTAEPSKPKSSTTTKNSKTKSRPPTKKTKKGSKAVLSKSSDGSNSDDSSANSSPERRRKKPSRRDSQSKTKQRTTQPKATKIKPISKAKGSKVVLSKSSDESEYSYESSEDSSTERRRKKPSKRGSRSKTTRKPCETPPQSNSKTKSPISRNEKHKQPVPDSKSAKSSSKCKRNQNFWAEVFMEEEQQWIAVDVAEAKILSEDTLKAKATQPICYVVAFSSSGHVKDVTIRYSDCDIGKLRDNEWWMRSIKPYRDRKTLYDRQEDETLRKRLEKREIPKTLAELKNHPLYVLKRHLLKFEAIYPPDVMPCGSFRNELVYPRSSVQTLNGRDNWVKQARVVRIGEKAYKTVKARPKFNRILGSSDEAQPLELFGLWQTEEYQPMVAVDGKVPRNAFGNVDLFMPKMLPIGTVHLQLAGLSKVARKLDLDCAPAVVGFEYHAGGCHPKLDGFVVCEEFKDVFVDAWRQEQSELKRRDEEKRQQRVYQRWAKLYKGLLIREKLEKRYAYDFSGSSKNKGKTS